MMSAEEVDEPETLFERPKKAPAMPLGIATPADDVETTAAPGPPVARPLNDDTLARPVARPPGRGDVIADK